MSGSMVVAGVAGALAAVGIVDLAAALAARSAAGRDRPSRARRALDLLARVGRGVGPPAAPLRIGDRVTAAAAPVSVADVMALKAGAAVAAVLGTLPLVASLPGRLGLVAPAVAAAAGFYSPDAWLARRLRARREAMAIELADVVDLLRVAVDAGLSTRRALGEVGRRHGGLLAAELLRTAEELELGVPRRAALAGLRARTPLTAAGALTGALERADRLGASPSEALAALATDARAEHRRAVAERAARAAPKVQLVVALVLVPAVLLLVAAALLPALAF